MKKLIFVILFFLAPVTVFAADNYATSYQTYIDKTGVYQSSYSSYLTARSAYLVSGSLNSQNAAQSATLKMLQARDDVMTSYLNALKIKSTLPSSLINSINTEINWYNAHNTKLTSAGSLNDLVADSDEAKSQFQNSTQVLIYSSIINLGVEDNTNFRNQIVNEINILRAKIDEIKANQDKDVSSIERSLIDIQNKISRSQDKDNSALTLSNSVKTFSDAQTAVTDSNSYLKEANEGLLQIISQIKTN